MSTRGGEAPDAREETAAQPEPQAEEHAINELKGIIRTGSGMFRDLIELLAIEARLAGRSLALMLILAVVLALLAASAWLFLVAALGLWLIDREILSAPAVLLVLAAANGLLALVLGCFIHRLAHNLAFREFLKVIGGGHSTPDESQSE